MKRPALAAVLLAAAVAAVLVWRGEPMAPAATAGAAPPLLRWAAADSLSPPAGAGPTAALAAPVPALLTAAEREQRRVQLQAQLLQAQTALANYEAHAQYPHGSRPAREHPDQIRLFDPIREERDLRMPGGSATQGVKLQTSQDRVFLSGNDSARVSLNLVDATGRVLPMQITRATLQEVAEPGRPTSTPVVAVSFAEQGGTFSTTVHPMVQGYGSYAGVVRLEVWMQYAGQPGMIYFDFVYSPEVAARWRPGVREALVNGSLDLVLGLDVLRPGRYVVSARLDDAQGQPLGVLQFNDELPAGAQAVRLQVFGKLVRDAQSASPVAFPLRLRDVEAYLLKPDAHPDRTMLPRLSGVVHTTQSYPLSAFSDASWQSEERSRYLTEYGKDVKQLQQQLQQLQQVPSPRPAGGG